MGVREEAALWFDRADASFRHTVNPAPYLTNVAHARLALYYDMRRYDHVLELLPSVASSLEKLKMTRELFRCQYLEASALKESGRLAEARSKLRELVGSNASQSDETILGLALISLGDLESEEGFFDQAVSFYQEAMPIIQRSGRPLLSAHLKAAMGTTFRNQGKLNLAVETFRSASAEYDSLDMRSWVAYTHVLSAEVLLALNRTREAEWEILLALPVIQEQKMVPEGFAAMSLLNESVRRRKTDPRALREVREHLQASRS